MGLRLHESVFKVGNVYVDIRDSRQLHKLDFDITDKNMGLNLTQGASFEDGTYVPPQEVYIQGRRNIIKLYEKIKKIISEYDESFVLGFETENIKDKP